MQYERHTYAVDNPAAIRSIVLSDVDAAVEVLPSGDGSMHAVYYTSDKESYDIIVEGGTLYIRKKMRIMMGFLSFLFTPGHVRLTMYLPEGYAGDLSITTVDGDITVRGVAMASLAVKATDGDISLDRSRIGGGATCKTVDGDIAVGSIAAADVSLRTTDGDIRLDCPIVGDRLACRTTDGDITGTLTGRISNYTFTIRTGDGHSNVAAGGTGKTLCEMKTVDGDIALSFERAD